MIRFKENSFLLIGMSYKTAPVEIREKFSFNSENIPVLLFDISKIKGIRECVVISTCNRTEIYAVINEPHDEVRERIERYILGISGMREEYSKYFFYYNGRKVIEHLFSVTSGLDSMIVGEPQILGQVKKAYALACDNGFTGHKFNRLFHQTFQAAKQIRNITSIGKGAISISSATVILAKKVFGCLEQRKILMVGAGKIGRLCAKQFIASGVDELYITNRTIKRAKELAEELSIKVIPIKEIPEMFEKADVIITSVRTSTPLITKKLIKKNIEARNGSPLALIDLGVPRNIDHEVACMENIHLFNIDNLEDVIHGNLDKRKKEAEKAKELINKKVNEYYAWIEERKIIPAIHNLREKCENIRLDELRKVNNKVTEETFNTIDLVTRRIVRKILHNPTITMRTSESDEERSRLVKSINELFINDPVS